MVQLNVTLTNLRLSHITAIPQAPIHLTVHSSTRRLQHTTPTANNDLTFPAHKIAWTEHLPDKLALRAATLHISAFSSLPPRKLPRLNIRLARKPTLCCLGALALSFLDLATGTVTRCLRLREGDGQITEYILSFDVIVDQPAVLRLSFADVRVSFTSDFQPSQECFLSIEHVDGSRVRSTSFQPLHPSHNSNNHNPPHSSQPTTLSATCPTLPLTSPNLSHLLHSTLNLTLHTSPPLHHQTPLHNLWGILTHPTHIHPLSLPLSPTTTLHLTLSSNPIPPSSQMNGGVTTDDGITGAHPLIFGLPLPSTLRPSPNDNLPAGWVRLTDSFGYIYYRHIHHAVDVWTVPPDETVAEALRQDELRALHHGFVRGKHAVFHNRLTAQRTWIHPGAERSDISIFASSHQPPHPPPDSELSLETLDLSDLQTRPLPAHTDLHPAAFTHCTKPSLDLSEGEARRPNSRFPPGRVVEMLWTRLPEESFSPGVVTEGHTLTPVNRGNTLLKFAGAAGEGGKRLNTLDAFDVRTLTWTRLNASGVLPAARTGHAAVALGSDQSRLLIFGGSSPQGRRNDLHMYHVRNQTWSPVTCTGTPPEKRSRMGMTVASDASTALVFGGRSLYRFLGGEYYDALHVNAFHAERAQWVRMVPRGSGPRPAPRSGCVVEFINHRQMFVHGGYDDGDRFFDDTFLFDMVSSSWQQIAYPDEPRGPSPRESHASVMLDGKVFVYGGDSRNGLLNDLHMFNPATLRWEESPSLVGHGPGRVCGVGLAAIGESEALLVGGDSGFVEMTRGEYTLSISRRSTVDAKGMQEIAMERGPDAGVCVVCMDSKVDTMFLWCGHSVCCRACSRLVKHICPVCRQPFSEIVHSRFE